MPALIPAPALSVNNSNIRATLSANKSGTAVWPPTPPAITSLTPPTCISLLKNALPGPSKSLAAVFLLGPLSKSELDTPVIVYATLVASATLVVVSVNVVFSPSVIEAELAASAYDSPPPGVVLVSLIVTELDVATIVPLTLTVLTLAVNVSAPSVVASASGVTLNDPALLVITKLPVFAAKSPAFVTLQYSVVASSTFAVVTLNTNALPSSTLFAAGAIA